MLYKDSITMLTIAGTEKVKISLGILAVPRLFNLWLSTMLPLENLKCVVVAKYLLGTQESLYAK